jgi:hypothetical protein
MGDVPQYKQAVQKIVQDTATGPRAVAGRRAVAGPAASRDVPGPAVPGVRALSTRPGGAPRPAHLGIRLANNALVAQPGGPDPGAGNLANKTLAPGVYTAAAGSFLIQGGNLTLDAQGNANAVWVFQMATSLTVGGPGAAFPSSIILTNGAQAKNVFWQVGSAATINAGGGGTMVGTIISQAGAAISTAGNVALVTIEGEREACDKARHWSTNAAVESGSLLFAIAKKLSAIDEQQWQERLQSALLQVTKRSENSSYPGWWDYSAGALAAALGRKQEADISFQKALLLPDRMLSYHLTRLARIQPVQ